MSLAVLADHMASKGRGPDSMLIHMSPREVQGLQALAENHGGSLTINPETGLPEAGFLDKLLPTIIGAGLTFFGGVPPHIAAMMVGGVETVRTGDLGRGISAGLGAYGGANLTAGLTEAGASTIGAAEAAKGVTMTPELLAEFADNGTKDVLLQQQVADKMAAATPYEKLSSGFDAFKNNPTGMAKSLAMPAAMAFGPAILAGANVQSKGPQTITKPGMIRPYSFDPYGGTYTAGTPYETMPTKAAEGGLMGMNDGGYAPGQLNFAQRSEPVVRMARGGVAHFEEGGGVSYDYGVGGSGSGGAGINADVQAAINSAYAAGDYSTVNDIVANNNITAADVAATYQGFDTSGLAALGINVPGIGGGAPVGGGGGGAPVDYFAQQFAPDVFAPVATSPVVQAATAPVVQAATAPVVQAATTPAYTQYTDAQIGKYLIDNPTADITAAIKATNADPAAVNRYLASIADPFRGSTDTTGGSGVLGIYNRMVAEGIDPSEMYKAEIANDPKYAGYTQAMIQKAYDLSKGAYSLTDQIARDKIAADPKLGYDKQWVKFMEDNKYSVDDMAQAFGISKNEIRDRIQKVKDAENVTKVVTPITTVTGGTGTTIIPGVNDYGLGGTGTSGRLESVYGPALPPGVSGAGVTTVNPNGTITTRPDLSLQMKDVRDTYERGGGSLGVNKNLFVPKTQDELFARYKNTGGSKAALDYLMGKTPYDPVPYTKTGEIQKPYWESVGRFPENRSTKKYVFVDGKYQLNPDYVKPSYVLAGEKAAADKAAEEKTTKAGVDSGKSINVVDNQGNTEPAYMRDDGFYYTSGGNKYDEKGVQVAADGGLMAMARGGIAQQFNLGDYSDGGRLLRGPGDGVSDSIPASIGGKRPARLADGEFVVPARIVSELGNGSTEAGARKLYAMMDRIQKARRGTVGKGKVAKNSRSDKYLPA